MKLLQCLIQYIHFNLLTSTKNFDISYPKFLYDNNIKILEEDASFWKDILFVKFYRIPQSIFSRLKNKERSVES